jgi:hypothetical protein
MNKPWLGYLSSVLLLAAGAFMIADHQILVGCVFLAAALIGLVLRVYMSRK